MKPCTGKKPGMIERLLTTNDVAASRWLLVFDNVDSWDTIAPFWPSSCEAASSIAVTSQKAEFGYMTTHAIELPSLSLDDSVQLLLDLAAVNHPPSEEERAAAAAIADDFGGLPLAIVHIGGYVSQSRRSLCEFRDVITQRYPWIWEAARPASLHQYHNRLEAVWDIALGDLPPTALELIYIMAFLNPDSVPEELLRLAPALAGTQNAEYALISYLSLLIAGCRMQS